VSSQVLAAIQAKPAPAQRLQRKCSCGGTAGPDGECAECKKKRSLQRRSAGPDGPTEAPPIVHDVLRSAGQPLDPATRRFMEPRLGHDFGRVRVHADSKADESARAVNALAYTVGQDIVFASGRHAPSTREGRELIAHELTHVVQQAGSITGSKLAVADKSDALEVEAEHIAGRVLNSGTAAPAGRSSEKLHRQPDDSSTPATGQEAATPGQGSVPTGATTKTTPVNCPAPKMACQTGTGFGAGRLRTIRFQHDSADLDGKARYSVRRIAKAWNAYGASDQIFVEGYASVEGSCQHNWPLSCSRAQAVAAELTKPSDGSAGVPAVDVAIVAHGQSQLAGPSLEANRRVTVNLPPFIPKPTPKKPDPPPVQPEPKEPEPKQPDPCDSAECDKNRAQLALTVTKWDAKGYHFAAALLQHFLLRGRGTDAGNMFQRFAPEIQGSIALRDHLNTWLWGEGSERFRVSKATSIDLSHWKTHVEYYSTSSMDLLYALGGADFEITAGILTKEPGFFKSLVCTYNVDPLSWTSSDNYTFPPGAIREWFSDYAAAKYLEDNCCHPHFTHYETGTFSTYCVARPGALEPQVPRD